MPKIDGTNPVKVPASGAKAEPAAESRSADTSGTSLIGADGKVRQGWGWVEAPETPPPDTGKYVEAPKYGDVDFAERKPDIPTEIRVPTGEPRKYENTPIITEVKKVEYTEPPKPIERSIEVAGAGMGSYKKYTMLESEALAVYTIIRDNKGSVSPEELKKQLKDKYGIDADITTVDGHIALVNKKTGNAIAVDTEGNGALGFEDLQFKDALVKAGIDPDVKHSAINPLDLVMKIINEANALSKRRQQEEEGRAQQRAAAAKPVEVKVGPASASTETPSPSPTPTPQPSPSPVPVATSAPSAPPSSVGPKSTSY